MKAYFEGDKDVMVFKPIPISKRGRKKNDKKLGTGRMNDEKDRENKGAESADTEHDTNIMLEMPKRGSEPGRETRVQLVEERKHSG